MAMNGDFVGRRDASDAAVVRSLTPGLVLHLDPEVLLDRRAVHDGSAIEGTHFFVCVWVDEETDQTFWIPTSSKRRPGRCELPAPLKTGHPAWVRVCSYAVVDQVWVASTRAVLDAAYMDGSRETAPNRVTREGLERLREAL
jgi:hypothetical protein